MAALQIQSVTACHSYDCEKNKRITCESNTPSNALPTPSSSSSSSSTSINISWTTTHSRKSSTGIVDDGPDIEDVENPVKGMVHLKAIPDVKDAVGEEVDQRAIEAKATEVLEKVEGMDTKLQFNEATTAAEKVEKKVPRPTLQKSDSYFEASHNSGATMPRRWRGKLDRNMAANPGATTHFPRDY